MTADGALELARCREGERLLIVGATGGVGVLAIQLAAAAGISVIATARADAAEQVEALGAARTIDHSRQAVAEALDERIDAVLDCVGDAAVLAAIAPRLRDGGAIVSIAFGVDGALAQERRITAINYQLDDKPARLRRVAEAVAAGRLRIPIQDEVGLDDAPAAVARNRRGGARGKTVVRV
jgi:NADPH:quinone reductase-like Zn-dependent oxidoreductase